MKKVIALLLALCVLLPLVACGKDKPLSEAITDPAKNPSSATSGESDKPYVEEVPTANVLDEKNPIPADTGTLELKPVTFESVNLVLNLPEGVTARETQSDSGDAAVAVADDNGRWVLYFEPFKRGEYLYNNVESVFYYGEDCIKQDWSRDAATELAGFPARVWANNTLRGWLMPDDRLSCPGVDVLVDYGETLVGPWYGLHIRLEAQNSDEDTNIYELLYLRHVRDIIHNVEVMATPDGITKSAGGITLTFPARWEVKQGDNGFVTSFHSAELTGGINFGTTLGTPAEAASQWEGETFTQTVEGRTYQCVIRENNEDPDNVYYNMKLFSDYSDSRCLDLFVSLRGYEPADYKTFLRNEQFVSVLASMEIDPNGYRKPGTAEVNGFESDRGTIYAYTGSDSLLEVPALVGDMDTTVIGWGAFAGNTDITSVVIPEGVTVIEGCAFEGCSNLETVILPQTLMEIGNYAFDGCTSLRDVVLPETVTFVGSGAFNEAGCGSFTGPGAFYSYNCFTYSGFDSITIASGADLSGDYMFSACAATEVNLPNDLEMLGQGAFSGCRNLDELTLPDTLRELGAYCFANMGYLQIELSGSLEYIPDSCFSSTNLDVLVVPESVQYIESYAIYDAAYVVLQNPAVELYSDAVMCNYLYIEDAANFVFPEEMALWVQELYLDGVYDPSQIQGDLGAQYVDWQVYLPMDATYDEAAALDAYLLSVGMEEIAWIGTAADFLPTKTRSFKLDGVSITGVDAASGMLSVPAYVMHELDGFWVIDGIDFVADGAFAGSTAAAAYLPGNFLNGVGGGILEGCANLRDIWFNYLVDDDLTIGAYSAEAFAGVPADVTVHLPASFTEEQLAAVKDGLLACGLPETAAFETYSLR